MGISQQLICYQILDTVYTDQQDSTYEQIRYDVRTKYYTQLFDQLIEINLDQLANDKHKLQYQDANQCITGLQQLIKYFEQIEHYEKCSVIVEYIDELKDIN